MKTAEEMRPKFDVLVYRWIRNGMEQRRAKERVCESDNRFEIRDEREHFARLVQEAGEIRDELFEAFVKTWEPGEGHVRNNERDPELCDKYEFRLQKIWNTSCDVVRLRKEILKARTEESADYFREALKTSKKQEDIAVELLFKLLMDAQE